MDKNFKYQQVINALIRDGVDVEKYMQGFINKMTWQKNNLANNLFLYLFIAYYINNFIHCIKENPIY